MVDSIIAVTIKRLEDPLPEHILLIQEAFLGVIALSEHFLVQPVQGDISIPGFQNLVEIVGILGFIT